MRTGVIVYVHSNPEDLAHLEALESAPHHLNADAVCLAANEGEISHGWWRLITRGIREVYCLRARWDSSLGMLVQQGHPMRLCG